MINKIAIITRSMYAGGAERVIAQLIKYLDSMGMETILITIDDEKVLYDIPSNTKLLPIGKKSSSKVVDRVKRYVKVRKIIKREKPDVVLSMPEDIGIYVIPALIGTNIPVVVSERNNPWVMPDKKITRLMRRVFYPMCQGFIFQTNMAESFFSKKIQSRGIVLQNPLDLSRIPEQYEGERKKEIVAAGRLTEQKNFELLIDAFAEFYKTNKEYKLIIYGEGHLRNRLETIASERIPQQSYSLPGRVTDLLERINSSSMFVLSSNFEGMPNVLIEAMAMGMPVIATDCPSGGPRELVKNNVNGILIPTNNKKELVRAMQILKDEQVCKKISNNALLLKSKLGSIEIYEKWVKYLSMIANK